MTADAGTELRTCSVRGANLTALGRYREAESLLTRAVSLATETFGESHPETGAALNQLGICHRYAGDFDRAREAYARAMTIAVEAFGEESDAAATVWHNLSGLHHSEGAFVKAEEAARRAVDLRRRLHGPEHSAVVSDLAVLAAALDGLERWSESEPVYLDALAFWEARIPGSYEVAVVLNNLAGVYGATNRLEEAEAASRRALAIKIALFGDTHPDVALTLLNLATILHDLGRIGEAQDAAERAAKIVDQAALSAKHPLRAHLNRMT